MNISHLAPLYFGGQLQEGRVSACLIHVPPLRQDPSSHKNELVFDAGGSRVATLVLFMFLVTQISATNSGNLSHLKLSGQLKPNLFSIASQPCFALLQRERQGGTGVSTQHIGA